MRQGMQPQLSTSLSDAPATATGIINTIPAAPPTPAPIAPIAPTIAPAIAPIAPAVPDASRGPRVLTRPVWTPEQMAAYKARQSNMLRRHRMELQRVEGQRMEESRRAAELQAQTASRVAGLQNAIVPVSKSTVAGLQAQTADRVAGLQNAITPVSKSTLAPLQTQTAGAVAGLQNAITPVQKSTVLPSAQPVRPLAPSAAEVSAMKVAQANAGRPVATPAVPQTSDATRFAEGLRTQLKMK